MVVYVNPRLYNELAEAYGMEKTPMQGDNQERRAALGKRLGYDVGVPHDLMKEEDGSVKKLPNGNTIEFRDALGLAVDPSLYAKRSCNTCYGRGIVVLHQPIDELTATKMRANATAAALLHEHRGKAAVRETERCMCAALGYARAVTKFSDALLKGGLARRVGWVKENANAMARERIELI